MILLICTLDVLLLGEPPPYLTSTKSPVSSTLNMTSFKVISHKHHTWQNLEGKSQAMGNTEVAVVASKKASSVPAVTPSILSPGSINHIAMCGKTSYSGSQAKQFMYKYILPI